MNACLIASLGRMVVSFGGKQVVMICRTLSLSVLVHAAHNHTNVVFY